VGLMFAVVRIAVVAAALWVASVLVPGIDITGRSTGLLIVELVGVAAIFVVVEELVKPVIKTLGCLFYALTLGLIGFVVNAMLLLLVGWLADRLGLPFVVAGFSAAFWGAIVISVVSAVLHLLIPNRLDAR
jgi:putative membrane protein